LLNVLSFNVDEKIKHLLNPVGNFELDYSSPRYDLFNKEGNDVVLKMN
jgi:hypothetical protein